MIFVTDRGFIMETKIEIPTENTFELNTKGYELSTLIVKHKKTSEVKFIDVRDYKRVILQK